MTKEMKSEYLPVCKEGKLAYNIIFEKSFNELSDYLEEFDVRSKRICIVTDHNVHSIYGKELHNLLAPYVSKITFYIFPAGESNKTLDTVRSLYEHLILEHFDRNDMLLALGGGVVGDLTGYAAATYLRGIDFIQIPTTLLAQVDSSIGGKTGVDFNCYKNMVGAFYQPRLVYMNLHSLDTLTDEDFTCGMGEILKHGIIKDATYYEWTIQNMSKIMDRDYNTLKKMVEKSCKIKKTVIENDPFEKGERALLNMGHTIGHAIEKLKNGTLLHGQCVALGTIAAAHISWKRGYLANEDFFEIRDMNVGFELPILFDGLLTEDVLEISKSDKKMKAGQIKFILLKNLGNAYIDDTVTDEEMIAAINFINADVEDYND